MKVFNLRKWYFDLLLPDDTLIYTYLAWVKLFGFSEMVLHVCKASRHDRENLSKTFRLSTGKDQPVLENNTIRLSEIEMGAGRTANVLRIRREDVDIDLSYVPLSVNDGAQYHLHIPATKNHRILWYPLHLKSQVAGNIKIGAYEANTKNANGYIDYMNSNIFPFNAPVQKLYWGRLHHDRLDLVYTAASGKRDDKQWNSLIIVHDNQFYHLCQFTVRGTDDQYSERLSMHYPKFIEIHGQKRTMSIKITIHHRDIISESAFIDRNDGHAKIKTRLLKYISKDPRGIKFMSTADIEITGNNGSERFEEIQCIAEAVEFRE